jgi:hypothetical protein
MYILGLYTNLFVFKSLQTCKRQTIIGVFYWANGVKMWHIIYDSK